MSGRVAAALLGPVRRRFTGGAWPEEPFLIGGLERKLEPLFRELAPRDVYQLIASHSGPFMAQGNDQDGCYHFAPGLTRRAALAALRRGIPVQIPGLQRTREVVTTLVAGLAGSLAYPPELFIATLFISPEGCGLPKHFDDRDTWIIGLGGEKCVDVAANHEVPYPDAVCLATLPSSRVLRYAHVPLSLAMPADAERFLVRRGSCLFLPRGCWHQTIDSSASWSLSIGLRRPSWAELALRVLDLRLVGDVEWRSPAPPVPELSTRTAHATALRRIAALRAAVDALEADALLGAEDAGPAGRGSGGPRGRKRGGDDSAVELRPRR